MPDGDFSSEHSRRQTDDRAVIAALDRLQQRSGLIYVPQADDDPAGLLVPPASEHRPIHPLYVLLDFILAMLLALVLQLPILLAMIAGSGLARSGVRQEELAANVEQMPGVIISVLVVQALVFFGAVWLRVRRLRRLPWSWLGLHRGMLTPAALGWGCLGGVIYLAANVVVSAIAQSGGLNMPDQNKFFPIASSSPLEIGLMGLGVVVLTPLWEELFFRGYATRVCVERFGVWPGVLCSALLFALPHLAGISQGQAILLFSVFFGGIALGWVYWRTRNLAVTVISHMIINFLGFLGFIFQAQQ